MSKNDRINTYVQDQSELAIRIPDANISLEQFKGYVKSWIDLDNQVKQLQQVIKERKAQKNNMSQIISQFMCKYDIEDLNTKEGRIRCKQQTVKKPVSKKIIKDKLNDYFHSDKRVLSDVMQLYNDCEQIEKVSLRRLKIS